MSRLGLINMGSTLHCGWTPVGILASFSSLYRAVFSSSWCRTYIHSTSMSEYPQNMVGGHKSLWNSQIVVSQNGEAPPKTEVPPFKATTEKVQDKPNAFMVALFYPEHPRQATIFSCWCKGGKPLVTKKTREMELLGRF